MRHRVTEVRRDTTWTRSVQTYLDVCALSAHTRGFRAIRRCCGTRTEGQSSQLSECGDSRLRRATSKGLRVGLSCANAFVNREAGRLGGSGAGCWLDWTSVESRVGRSEYLSSCDLSALFTLARCQCNARRPRRQHKAHLHAHTDGKLRLRWRCARAVYMRLGTWCDVDPALALALY